MNTKHDIQQVRGFGRYAAGTSEIYRPTNEDEVNHVFNIARNSGGKRRIAIRGGGHSFNGQALHNRDAGNHLILSTEAFAPDRIEFDAVDPNIVTLGSGVPWSRFVREAIRRAHDTHGPIRIPGSLQTGGKATAGGTMAGDCLSRFSGLVGKESCWIRSFKILMPNSKVPKFASEDQNTDLFRAVIGGHGFLGFVTEVTYYLTPLAGTRARTEVTCHASFHDLIEKQLELIRHEAAPLRAAAAAFQGAATTSQSAAARPRREAPLHGISSAWFSGRLIPSLLSPPNPASIKGAVFHSYYAEPSQPPLPGFPLYHKLHSNFRYVLEVLARHPFFDSLIELLLAAYLHIFQNFEDDIEEFLFFMDGDAIARKRFEKSHAPKLFPIVQQTYVVPTECAAKFSEQCERKIHERGLHPTESDMLFVAKDQCLLSANYNLDGFAVSFAFEPIPSNGGPPADVVDLLQVLSVDCLKAGGRIHLPKNSHVDKPVFRSMFQGQIGQFEEIKRDCDPDLLIQNPFSDQFFDF